MPTQSTNFNAAEYFVDRHLHEGRFDRTAMECGEDQITYAQLSERVNRLGSGLKDSLGVRMEERVFLLLPDIPEFAYCFFGAIKIGAVLPKDLRETLDDSGLLVGPGEPIAAGDAELPKIRQAIRRERKLAIAYRDKEGASSKRTIWPFALGFFELT